MLCVSACSSEDDEGLVDRSGITEHFNPYEVELNFETAAVSFATLVPLSAFKGPDLNLNEADCTTAQETHLRLLNVSRNELSVGGTVWVEMQDGIPLSTADSFVVSLIAVMDVMRDLAKKDCVDGFGLLQSQRLLIAVESGIPLTTVQWVLRAVERAGFSEVSLLVNSEQPSAKATWSAGSASPIVSGANQIPDYRLKPSHGVVLFEEKIWDQAIERHAQLAAADVGCVSYAWGPEWSRSRLTESSASQTVGEDGQIPVLALVPLEILMGASEPEPTRLVTGASCGSWGLLGTVGPRPSIGE